MATNARGQRGLAMVALGAAMLLLLAAESAGYHGRRAWTLRMDGGWFMMDKQAATIYQRLESHGV